MSQIDQAAQLAAAARITRRQTQITHSTTRRSGRRDRDRDSETQRQVSDGKTTSRNADQNLTLADQNTTRPQTASAAKSATSRPRRWRARNSRRSSPLAKRTAIVNRSQRILTLPRPPGGAGSTIRRVPVAIDLDRARAIELTHLLQHRRRLRAKRPTRYRGWTSSRSAPPRGARGRPHSPDLARSTPGRTPTKLQAPAAGSPGEPALGRVRSKAARPGPPLHPSAAPRPTRFGTEGERGIAANGARAPCGSPTPQQGSFMLRCRIQKESSAPDDRGPSDRSTSIAGPAEQERVYGSERCGLEPAAAASPSAAAGLRRPASRRPSRSRQCPASPRRRQGSPRGRCSSARRRRPDHRSSR